MRLGTSCRSEASRDLSCRSSGVILRSRLASLLLILVVPVQAQASGFLDLWLTPDQQGQKLFEQELYLEAAETYAEPARRAAAYYRGGDFESAAALYGAIGGADAAYNRGNALILLGRYEEAIASFDKALAERADWPEAAQNREIARVRFERLRPPDDDAGGTGGKLGADEIRFDDSGRVDRGGTGVEEQGAQQMSEEAMRAVWMRRVQSDPADFLRIRFAYQLQRERTGESDDE